LELFPSDLKCEGMGREAKSRLSSPRPTLGR
jgi:hypothetical protein